MLQAPHVVTEHFAREHRDGVFAPVVALIALNASKKLVVAHIACPFCMPLAGVGPAFGTVGPGGSGLGDPPGCGGPPGCCGGWPGTIGGAAKAIPCSNPRRRSGRSIATNRFLATAITRGGMAAKSGDWFTNSHAWSASWKR